MRLGQLARKLSIPVSDIASFLAEIGVQTDGSTNSRIPDEHLPALLSRFAPHLLGDLRVSESLTTEEESLPENQISAENADVEIIAAEQELPAATSETSVNAERLSGEDSVIKAPKVELKGLTVLGKIELPQPRKKEVTQSSEDNQPVQETPAQPLRERQQKNRPVRDRNDRRAKKDNRTNPIARQREIEQKMLEEQKKKESQREKEKRTQYYLNRVKNAAPPKQVRLVEEQTITMSEHQPEEKEVHGWWARFRRWLTSY